MARRSTKAAKSAVSTHVILRDLNRSRFSRSPFDNLRKLGTDIFTPRRVIYDPAKRSTSVFHSSGRHTPLTTSLLRRKSIRDKYLIDRCYSPTQKQRQFGSGGGGYRRRKPLPLKKAAIVLHNMQRRRC